MNDKQPQDKAAAQSLTAKFDMLATTYKRIFNLCYDALDAKADQEDRDKLREVLKELISRK